jgi:hypothetical protein
LVVLAGCATQPEYGPSGLSEKLNPDGSLIVYLSPATAKSCQEGGGCYFVTTNTMKALQVEFRKIRKECGKAF